MSPECRGSLVPHVDLRASCLAFPHTAGSCSFTPSLPSLATLVVAPVGWNASRLSYGRMTVPTKISKDKASWHTHGLRTPTPESSKTRERIATQPLKPWVPACPLVDMKGRTPILGGLEGRAYSQRITVSFEQHHQG